MTFPKRFSNAFPHFLFLLVFAVSTTMTAHARAAEEEVIEFDFHMLAELFRPHCVRVHIHAQSADGVLPAIEKIEDAINHERPHPVGGYWWDETHVVIPDEGLQDRFIRSIEIALPDAGENAEGVAPPERRCPARVAGRFIRLQAVLLEVLPDADGSRPEAFPLEFIDGDVGDTVALSYVPDGSEWRIKADSGLGASSRSDAGVEMIEVADEGVLVDADGRPLGLAFGDKLLVEDDGVVPYWHGRETACSPFLPAAEAAALSRVLRAQLARAALECRFAIRVTVEDGEEDAGDMYYGDEEKGLLESDPSEVRAAGFVVAPRRLLVPVPLSPRTIRRIEGVTVVLPDGGEIPASFAGALRDYMAVVVETAEDLPAGNIPPGFARLNPTGTGDESESGSESGNGDRPAPPPLREYIQRWRIDYLSGRRREQADYDRWQGTFKGFRDDAVVLTRMNEEDAHLAFDLDGNLAALSLTPRLVNSRDEVRGTVMKASPGFRPVAFLREKFRAGDVFDPALMPADGESNRRLIDPGIEFQPLDAETARLFHASEQTRGGEIGVLVNYVYPGSIAARLGLREQDILTRLSVEGRKEPLEIPSTRFSYDDHNLDMSFDELHGSLGYMPPPWPSRDNVVSQLLTDAGAGRRATLEYVREGKTERASFTTAYGEPDYGSAAKQKFARLGLTVKPVTFEVARYFRRADRAGVIVDRVVDGGKSAVAGVRKYLLITRVNGDDVTGPEDFARKVRPFEEGEAASIEFTVNNFGRTGLVKME